MFGVKAHAALDKTLNLSKSIDADGMISTELAYIEQAGKIVDRAMQVGRLGIATGARECDVGATVLHALSAAGVPEFPGSAGNPQTMPVGSPANAPHIKWTDAVYKTGCQTNFETGAALSDPASNFKTERCFSICLAVGIHTVVSTQYWPTFFRRLGSKLLAE